MATRIRTVKPDLFRHEGLFELEQETGLPVRLVFIGLFCCSDREGRFKWRPRELALDITPYEDVTRLSRVLDALGTRGFLVKYASGGDWYGMIPTFRRHQQINNREQDSQLPDVNGADEVFDFKTMTDDSVSNKTNDLLTRQPRVDIASAARLEQEQGEGKGREGKGIDQELLAPSKNPESPKQKPKPKPATDFQIPDWVDAEAWEGFVDMRKKIKKPMTENAMRLAINELKKLAAKGHHPDAVLNQSTMNSYQGLFEVKNGSGFQTNTGGRGAGRLSAVDQVREANDRAAERRRLAGQATAGSGDLQDSPPPYGLGDFDGEFERIDDADGKIVGDDGGPVRP